MIRLRQVCFVTPMLASADDSAEIFAVAAVYRDPLVRTFGLENVLLGFGGTFVEFVAPLQSGTPATRFLAKHPAGGGTLLEFNHTDGGSCSG